MSEPRFHLLPDAPTPVAPFSHAVETDGWVFLTDQMPTDPDDDTKPLPVGVEAQTRRVMDNLIIVLKSLDLGRPPPGDAQPVETVEKVRRVLRELLDCAEMNRPALSFESEEDQADRCPLHGVLIGQECRPLERHQVIPPSHCHAVTQTMLQDLDLVRDLAVCLTLFLRQDQQFRQVLVRKASNP